MAIALARARRMAPSRTRMQCLSFSARSPSQPKFDEAVDRRCRSQRGQPCIRACIRQGGLQGLSESRMDAASGCEGQDRGPGLHDLQVQGRRQLLRDLRQEQGRQEGRSVQDDGGRVHRIAGYAAAGLVVTRLVWALLARGHGGLAASTPSGATSVCRRCMHGSPMRCWPLSPCIGAGLSSISSAAPLPDRAHGIAARCRSCAPVSG